MNFQYLVTLHEFHSFFYQYALRSIISPQNLLTFPLSADLSLILVISSFSWSPQRAFSFSRFHPSNQLFSYSFQLFQYEDSMRFLRNDRENLLSWVLFISAFLIITEGLWFSFLNSQSSNCYPVNLSAKIRYLLLFSYWS